MLFINNFIDTMFESFKVTDINKNITYIEKVQYLENEVRIYIGEDLPTTNVNEKVVFNKLDIHIA